MSSDAFGLEEVVSKDWGALLEDEAVCKLRRTCPDLGVRELFFEPNPGTLAQWRERYGYYRRGLDRRVVFVAESPADRRPRGDPADFEVTGRKGWRCWDYTSQDLRFRKVRAQHGFQDCLVTNAVKCGRLRPSTPARLTDAESENCVSFLKREVETVSPAVVVCVGGSAHRIVQRYLVPRLEINPEIMMITHYSFRGSLDTLMKRWDAEFGSVKAALKARNLSVDSGIYIDWPENRR